MSTNRIDQLLKFLEKSPEDSFLMFAIAKEHEKLKVYDKALKYYLDIHKKDPEYIGMYYHLGKLYELINRRQLALNIYQQGIEIGKKQGDFHAVSELNNAKMNLELEIDN